MPSARPARSLTLRAWFDLLTSMRFAISLLTVLSIASIIGTVVKQNEPFNNYLNQFGPFWFPVFEKLGLYGVYNAGWFLVILVFLVVSTSLCLVRQGPQMVREMKTFRTHAREASLRQFAHKAHFTSPHPSAELVTRLTQHFNESGFRCKQDPREGAVLVAGKAGWANRLGYFLAHGGIVVICVGGLLDGNLPLKIQLALGDKHPTSIATLRETIPPSARLEQNTLSFRGNLFVPEGQHSNLATLNIDDGVLVLSLPFDLKLKKFTIEHYTTGAPKRFASDVIITDLATGEQYEHTIEVNRPLIHQGLAIYQSSFDDGGSRLEFRPHAFAGGAALATLSATVGSTENFPLSGASHTLELTGFRSFNIENMSEPEPAPDNALASLQTRFGSAIKPAEKKDLRNVGPNVQFKVRDAAGQAREYQNYMLPITQEGRAFMLSGMRTSPNEGFRYLRMPVDEDGRIETFFALRAALMDTASHPALAQRFARASLNDPGGQQRVTTQLAETTERTLGLFAEKGFEAIGRFIEQNVPADEREKAADVFLKILQGSAWDAWQLMREKQGQAALPLTPERAQFVRDTLWAASDAFHYGSPVYLQLTGFDEIRASVFQVTRSPGQPWVFLGSLLLVAGVCCMLFIRERRVFALVKDGGEVLFAMSANRKTLDFEDAFQQQRDQLQTLVSRS